MTKPPTDKPAKPAAKPGRTEREATALRANLLKRKDQVRQRQQTKEKDKPDR